MEKCATYLVGVNLPLTLVAKKTTVMRATNGSCGHGTMWASSIVPDKSNDRLRSAKRMSPVSSTKAQHMEEDDDTTCSTTTSASESSDEEDELSSSSLCEHDDGDDCCCGTSIYSDCRSIASSTRSSSSPPPPLYCGGGRHSVSFATPLITDIHFRPRTLRQDKAGLYYCDADYRWFRRDAYREARKKAADVAAEEKEELVECGHGVRFRSPQVVTSVWEYETDDKRDDSLFWYSEAEIQDFLDDFVESLVLVGVRVPSTSASPTAPLPEGATTIAVSS